MPRAPGSSKLARMRWHPPRSKAGLTTSRGPNARPTRRHPMLFDLRKRDSPRVLLDAAVDQWQVLASPGDRSLEPLAQHGRGLETEHALGLLGAAEALARVVPLPGRAEVEW